MAPYHSKAYLSTQIQTDRRMDLLIALYEGALAYLARAINAIEAGDEIQRAAMIQKSSNVIMALSDSLDYSQPSSLAGRLFGIYNFHLEQLLEANRKNDAEPLYVVKSSLSILLEGWREVEKSPEAREIRAADAARQPTRIAPAPSAGRAAVAMTV